MSTGPGSAIDGSERTEDKDVGKCDDLVVPWLPVLAGLMTWSGVTFLIDAQIRRNRRPDLVERLLPYQPASVAAEAESWLQQQ